MQKRMLRWSRACKRRRKGCEIVCKPWWRNYGRRDVSSVAESRVDGYCTSGVSRSVQLLSDNVLSAVVGVVGIELRSQMLHVTPYMLCWSHRSLAWHETRLSQQFESEHKSRVETMSLLDPDHKLPRAASRCSLRIVCGHEKSGHEICILRHLCSD